MTKHDFSDEECYAVYTIHGEKCYMCREPLDFFSMDVDHVIPESLLDDSVKLAEVLATFGVPNDFDLQSFENWLPACKPCNLRKGERAFDATPRIQMDLQIAREKAAKAAELAGSRVTDKSAARAWNVIKRAER